MEREKLFRTRYDEAKYLISYYPEFADKLPQRGLCDREPHQMVLFEALALAHQAMQGGASLLARKMSILFTVPLIKCCRNAAFLHPRP